MYNHMPGAASITRKDRLVKTVNQYAALYSSRPECFNKDTMVPRSYRLHDEKECEAFFEEINTEAYNKKKKEIPFQYIQKQGVGAHKAAGIDLFDQGQELELKTIYANGENCGKVNSTYVMQKYISNPLLLDRNNKFDFRMYMLIASNDPLIAFYHDGFLRVSLETYNLSSTDRAAHLTNTQLSKEKFAEARGNKTLEKELREYQMWTLEDLQEHLLKIGKITDPDWLNNYLRPKFKKAYIHLIRMSQKFFWKHSSVFEMFGLDFMLDQDLNLWLIECNSSPQLIGTNKVKTKMMVEMLVDLFEIEYAYLRSKMKRLTRIAHDFHSKILFDKPFDLETEKKAFAEANRNFLESEFSIRAENSWRKILDENISGKGAYMGNLEEECIIDLV